jgi:hypothetical protein
MRPSATDENRGLQVSLTRMLTEIMSAELLRASTDAVCHVLASALTDEVFAASVTAGLVYRIQVYKYIYICVCIYIDEVFAICACTCTCACTYVCVCVCVCMCVCILTRCLLRG